MNIERQVSTRCRRQCTIAARENLADDAEHGKVERRLVGHPRRFG
jgi:hypothetical protein